MTQRPLTPLTPFVMRGLYPWEEPFGEVFKLWMSLGFAGLRFWTGGRSIPSSWG